MGGIVIFSGGSAANHLVDIFNSVAQTRACPLSYVVPITDNGGSSSELIRVFGGPGIGDLRSRLLRLIPNAGPHSRERLATKSLFNHRLSADPNTARVEWLDIVEARHPLWDGISSPQKELIRSFLNAVNLEIVKRARPSSVFGFDGASIGNLFLTGARLFTGSLESAIYLLSGICEIPAHISVLPAINANFSYHICAGLENGEIIPGQNAISHPSIPTSLPSSLDHQQANDNPEACRTISFPDLEVLQRSPSTKAKRIKNLEVEHADTIEDATLPGSLPTLRRKNLNFDKATEDDLPSRIDRIWYINPYGQEIRPPANPRVLDAIRSAHCIIYSIGSLYTSIIPSVILRGVGDAIASAHSATSSSRHMTRSNSLSEGFNGAANSGISTPDSPGTGTGTPTSTPRSLAKTKILILNGTLDRETGPSTDPLRALDFIRAIARAGLESRGVSLARGTPIPAHEVRAYVTHLVYLDGPGVPAVDRDELACAGVECVRVYGRRVEGGRGARYDVIALRQALVALVGGTAGGVNGYGQHGSGDESGRDEDFPLQRRGWHGDFARVRRHTVER